VLDVTRHPTTFGDVPGARPFVDALLAGLPASKRTSADGGHGIIYVGPLV
jgi:hypothetical protein